MKRAVWALYVVVFGATFAMSALGQASPVDDEVVNCGGIKLLWKNLNDEQKAECAKYRREQATPVRPDPRVWSALKAQTRKLIQRGKDMQPLRGDSLPQLRRCGDEMRANQEEVRALRKKVDAQGLGMAQWRGPFAYLELCVSCAPNALEYCAHAAAICPRD